MIPVYVVIDFIMPSAQAGPPRYWYLEQGHGHLELLCQRYL